MLQSSLSARRPPLPSPTSSIFMSPHAAPGSCRARFASGAGLVRGMPQKAVSHMAAPPLACLLGGGSGGRDHYYHIGLCGYRGFSRAGFLRSRRATILGREPI
jgi:hypothetical protein